MKRWALCCFLLLSCVAFADEGHHHEELTTEQLGTVHFPVSCDASVQKPFERGVALLHSFWYEEAEKQFQEVADHDPKCAMAHWGLAMSYWHQLWDHPKAGTIDKGVSQIKAGLKLHPPAGRERDYLKAMDAFYGGSAKRDFDNRAQAYSHAMEQMFGNYPDDKEAAVFFALSLLASAPANDTTFANRKKAAAVLEPLFTPEPDHPGVAHYLIHSYDKPQLAALGLPAARRYAQVAPASPHALHMPSHIFARLGLWQDDIDSNLASVAATRKTAAMHMGGEGHQFHAMDFLVYAYLQSGREADAMKLIEEVKAMPPMKSMYDMDYDMRTFALSEFSASYVLEMHHWSDAAALEPVPGADPSDEAVTHLARAIGAARNGNPAQAQREVAKIEALHQKLLAAKKKGPAEGVDGFHTEAQAWADFSDGKQDQALSAMRAMAEKDEASGEEVGGIPAREMLADMLIEMKRPDQALVEYEADLKFNPNRFNSTYGAAQAAEMAGKTQKANYYYAQLVKVCSGSSSDRPELARAKALVAQK